MSGDPISIRPIGTVVSQVSDPAMASRQPDEGAPAAVLALDEGVREALDGLRAGDRIVVVTWLHHARRDVRTTHPRNDPRAPLTGVFATRGPDRPNPIGLHEVGVTAIDGLHVHVDRLEAIDGTPILDIKPVLAPLPDR